MLAIKKMSKMQAAHSLVGEKKDDGSNLLKP